MRTVVAQSMVIDHGTGEVKIDGARLPWYLAEGSPTIGYDFEKDWSVVNIPVIVERQNIVEITTVEQDIEWIREVGRRELAAARFWFAVKLGHISAAASARRPLDRWSFTEWSARQEIDL